MIVLIVLTVRDAVVSGHRDQQKVSLIGTRAKDAGWASTAISDREQTTIPGL